MYVTVLHSWCENIGDKTGIVPASSPLTILFDCCHGTRLTIPLSIDVYLAWSSSLCFNVCLFHTSHR